jgi:hypothetical protein
VTKILAKKIVSLYLIFFSKIMYLYRFKRYIFEYRCPPLPTGVVDTGGKLTASIVDTSGKFATGSLSPVTDVLMIR